MKFKLKENHLLTPEEDGGLLVNTGTFQSSHLNQDGIRLFELIKETDKWESLLEKISEKLGSPISAFEDSVKKFFKVLFQLGILEFESVPDWIKQENYSPK